MKIRAANGSYSPSNFYMHIESNEQIEECVRNNEQTFVHEYIHFLQDLILPYSIRNTLTSKRRFLSVLLHANKVKKIIRPFSEWDDDTQLTDRQFSSTWGCDDFIDENVKIKSLKNEFFTIDTGARVFKYILVLENNSEYHVGARDFLEYIAHKIETKHWETSHPHFPYMTVDSLFDFLGFDYVADEVRVCFVEYCLYNDNPLNMFFNIIEELKINNMISVLDTFDSCSHYLINRPWEAKGGFNETIFTKTQRRLFDFKESLSLTYSGNNFPNIQRWIQLVIDFANTELSNKFIFAELFRLNGDDFFIKINGFIQEIGIPLVMNNNGECISLLPEDFDQNEFMQLLTVLALMIYVSGSDRNCALIDLCRVSNPNVTNSLCTTNPILRAHDDELCPFGLLIKNYGLHKIDWEYHS